MKSIKIVFALFLISCGSIESDKPYKKIESLKLTKNSITYTEINPTTLNDFILDGYQVNQAFEFDSFVVGSAYAHGDVETSENPDNWGDRLIMIENQSIVFESKPVGDVYLYEPHFFRNSETNKTIIIAQLAYEYNFGGDVFLLENEKMSFLGNIEIDGPDLETALTDIVQVSENDDSFNFHFKSDSLNFNPGNEDRIIPNNNVHYSYKQGVWKFYK